MSTRDITVVTGFTIDTYCARCAPSRRSTMTNVTDSWANI